MPLLLEQESTQRALLPAEPFTYADKAGVETVMGFLCAPVTKPWWPPDPLHGPSADTISEGPMSRLAHELAGKTMIMIGDSVMEQTCGALVCALRRDAGLNMQRSDKNREWEELLHGPKGALLDGLPHGWKAQATGFTLGCFRMNQYNPELFNSKEKYNRILRDLSPDVLIVNHGAHHSPNMVAYSHHMRSLFELIQFLGYKRPSHGAEKVFVWSATTAQHFDTPSGDFDPVTQERSSCFCASRLGSSTALEQSKVAGKLAKIHGFGHPLDMFKLTRHRYTLHNEGCRKFMLRNSTSYEQCPPKRTSLCDCTHLCYSPAFFDTVAEHLRISLGFQPPNSSSIEQRR